MGSFFSFGVGRAWLWVEPVLGGMPGRQERERSLPSRFPSPGSSRLLPTPSPTSACPCLAGTRTLLPARLPPQPPLASQSPLCCHSVPTGMPGWLWAELGVPLLSLSLQQHSCHKVRGLVPEPCQPLQPCPCLGTPGIQGLGLGAPLHPQSGLRARHSPSTWVTLLPDAMSQGRESHRLPSRPACPAKGPGDPLPKPPRWVQAGWEPRGSSLQPGALSSSHSPLSIRPPSLANSAHAHAHHTHTHK